MSLKRAREVQQRQMLVIIRLRFQTQRVEISRQVITTLVMSMVI